MKNSLKAAFNILPLLILLYNIITLTSNTDFLQKHPIFNLYVALLLLVILPFNLLMNHKLNKSK